MNSCFEGKNGLLGFDIVQFLFFEQLGLERFDSRHLDKLPDLQSLTETKYNRLVILEVLEASTIQRHFSIILCCNHWQIE